MFHEIIQVLRISSNFSLFEFAICISFTSLCSDFLIIFPLASSHLKRYLTDTDNTELIMVIRTIQLVQIYEYLMPTKED